LALLGGSGSTFPTSGAGGGAQDALAALLSANNTSSSNPSSGSSTSGPVSNADLALALALYQSQVDQQLFASMTGPIGTSI
jgi:hypothetical protein